MSDATISDWISVGEVSAERDQNLTHYFYDAGVSKGIISNNKQYLLLGRKGAGKTAVFYHLIARPSDLFGPRDAVAGLSLQSYNWQAHNLLIDQQKVGGFQHRDSWRFVLCLEALRATRAIFKERNEDLPKGLAKALKVVEKIFSGPLPSWTDLIGNKLFSIASLKLPKGGISEDGIEIGGGELTFDQVKKSDTLISLLNQNVATLTDWLENCLLSLPAPYRIFLIFDRLDEAWVPGFIEESKAIISGLIHAAEHILTKFGGRIRPLVLLREDIFSTFDINDRNKLREDCSSSLRWTQAEIEKLIVARINFYARRAGAPEISGLQEIFAEQKIRSKTTPVKHVFNRTMCRPRDMVALLGRVIAAIKDDARLVEGNKILSKAIYDAEPGYSDYLYEELSDEWRNQNAAFIAYLQAIENIRYAVFASDELEAELTKKGVVVDRASFRAVARFLFENSIIGIAVGGSKQWRYRCFYPNQAFLDAEAIKIHPGLIKHLGLIERTSPNAPRDVEMDQED